MSVCHCFCRIVRAATECRLRLRLELLCSCACGLVAPPVVHCTHSLTHSQECQTSAGAFVISAAVWFTFGRSPLAGGDRPARMAAAAGAAAETVDDDDDDFLAAVAKDRRSIFSGPQKMCLSFELSRAISRFSVCGVALSNRDSTTSQFCTVFSQCD